MEIIVSDETISELNHFTQQTPLNEMIDSILKAWVVQQKTTHKRQLGALAGSAQIMDDIVNSSPNDAKIWQVLQ